ncbi:MAG: hypothetical protein ABR920_13790 [Terriglobales bacterium]
MKQPVVRLTHEGVREICAAIRDGFSSIALALFESRIPVEPDIDPDPALPSKNRLVFNVGKSEK